MSSQLQRFISFAFAAADLLIEVGAAGEIRFALGAAMSLTNRHDNDLVGSNWLELFDPADHSSIQDMVSALGPQGRCGPLPVRMAVGGSKGASILCAALSACRLTGPQERLSCVLTALPTTDASDKPLADIEEFIDAARQAEKEVAQLTFIDAPGLLGLAQSDPTTCQALTQRITTLLQSSAISNKAVAQLSETRFGVAHGNDASSLCKGLADITEEGATNGVHLGISTHHLDLASDGLQKDELLQVVRFVVNRFATQGAAAKLPGSAAQAFDLMVDSALQRMNNFATVVREEKFDLSFQPIVSLTTGALHHFEVLSRFCDGSSPFEQIQFAEEVGVIEKFDYAVCMRSIAVMRSRHGDAGPRSLRLAVNISGQSLDNAVFIRLLLGLLDENTDLAGQLSLEITESVRLRDLVRAERVVQEVRRRGFAVYLDDFGAGAASFQYLQALTIDGVKIDGTYIKRIGRSQRDDALLRGLARLCGDLKIATVGEMVETVEQNNFLRNAGVTLGQGWLFGKPSPIPSWAPENAPASMPAWFRARRQGTVESWM
jgi:EAL domain-containing protein (putative c-di-GMP-specific phosphodiesterase class I)